MGDYAQPSQEQRYHIYVLKNTGHSQAAIAKPLVFTNPPPAESLSGTREKVGSGSNRQVKRP